LQFAVNYQIIISKRGEGKHQLHAGQGDQEGEAPGGQQEEDRGRTVPEVSELMTKLQAWAVAFRCFALALFWSPRAIPSLLFYKKSDSLFCFLQKE